MSNLEIGIDFSRIVYHRTLQTKFDVFKHFSIFTNDNTKALRHSRHIGKKKSRAFAHFCHVQISVCKKHYFPRKQRKVIKKYIILHKQQQSLQPKIKYMIENIDFALAPSTKKDVVKLKMKRNWHVIEE